VFLVLIVLVASLSSIMVAAESDRVVVEDFDPIYYTNEKDTATVSTKITIIGDNINGNDVPVKIGFYDENDTILSSYELDKELRAYEVGVDKWGHPEYKYKNYTGEFGFVTEKSGLMNLRLIVTFDHSQYYNQVHSVDVNVGMDPKTEDPSHNTKIISGAAIILILVILIISMILAGVAIKHSRKDLSSETHMGLDIEAEDTEIGVCLDDDTFKRVPSSKRGPVSLKSQTSQSEIDME